MIRGQRFYWIAQITGWLLLSSFLMGSIAASEEAKKVPGKDIVISFAVFFVLGVVISHVMRVIFIRRGWLDLKLGPLIPRILGASILASVAMSLLSSSFSLMFKTDPKPFELFPLIANAIVLSIFFLMWNGLYFTFHFFQKSRVQEVKNLQLSASQNEIELKNLRSQLNPHFLFNSLNSIRALIDLDPVQAKENVTTLSNLLRKSLILGKEQLVSLKDELDLVNDYLDLEKVRFEERLSIVIRHNEKLNDFPIPPFIVQTLVENAFKHGISKLIAGGTIIIETKFEGTTVTIRVINDGTLAKSVDTGIGLQNTLRRLELQYGVKARFALRERAGKVTASIELKEQAI
ncbi:MAG TPA: histidine kinase [Fluviicola sp.]|nr:histidine kinase [Fluviicola sp.]